MIETYITGIFPRNNELINLWRKWDKGLVNKDEFHQGVEKAAEEVIRIQLDSCLTYVHDPLIDWHDIFRPFTNLPNLTPGPLTRFFENNTFYRKPIFEGNIKYIDGFILDYVHKDLLPSGIKPIMSLPGPYTFFKLSYHKDKNTAIESISNILLGAIRDLIKDGYEFINLLEPALAYYKDIEWDLVEKLYSQLIDFRDYIRIHNYFGDILPKIDKIIGLPVNGLSIDGTYTYISKLAGLKFNKVALGLIDSRTTLLEDPSTIIDLIKNFKEKNKVGSIAVTPNTDLDYLPFEYALKKLTILRDIRGC